MAWNYFTIEWHLNFGSIETDLQCKLNRSSPWIQNRSKGSPHFLSHVVEQVGFNTFASKSQPQPWGKYAPTMSPGSHPNSNLTLWAKMFGPPRQLSHPTSGWGKKCFNGWPPPAIPVLILPIPTLGSNLKSCLTEQYCSSWSWPKSPWVYFRATSNALI